MEGAGSNRPGLFVVSSALLSEVTFRAPAPLARSRSAFTLGGIMTTPTPSGSMWTLSARVFWMLLGPLLLALALYQVITAPEGGFRSADAVYLALVAALPAARWIEFQGGDPRLATGEPATRGHLRTYALRAILGGLWVWISARAAWIILYDH